MGSRLTFTATVIAGDAPTGTITFLDNGTTLGTVPLGGSGSATLTTSLLAPGSHSITATYSGDSQYASATPGQPPHRSARPAPRSPWFLLRYLKKKKVVSENLTAQINPISPGGGVPTGSVTFEILTKKKKKTQTKILGTASLSGGKATLTLKAKSVLQKVVTVVYSGGPDYLTNTLTAPKLPKNWTVETWRMGQPANRSFD